MLKYLHFEEFLFKRLSEILKHVVHKDVIEKY